MIKKFLILSLLTLGFSASASAQNLFLDAVRIQKNELTTVEKGRRYFSKAKCCAGEVQKTPYVEITYVTTDKCGKAVEWKKVYKTGGPVTAAGVPIDREEEFDKNVNNAVNTIFNPAIIRTIIGKN